MSEVRWEAGDKGAEIPRPRILFGFKQIHWTSPALLCYTPGYHSVYPTPSRFGGGQEDAPSNPMRFPATMQLPLGEVWGFGVYGDVGKI